MPLLSRSLRYLAGAAVALIATLTAMVAVPASAFAGNLPVKPMLRVHSVSDTGISIDVFAQTYGDTLTSLTVTAEPGDLVQTVANPQAGQDTTVSFTSLAPTTSYTFTATATDASGDSPVSDPLTTATGSTVPDPPTGVVGEADDQQIDVSWTAPGNNGGMPVTDYIVRAVAEGAPAGNATEVAGDVTHAVVDGLSTAYIYDISVTAENVNGAAWHDAVPDDGLGVLARIPQPTDLSLYGGVGDISASWSPVAHATGYAVCVSASTYSVPSSSSCTPAATTDTSYDATGLVSGYAYTVTVFAEGINGGESWGTYATLDGTSLTTPKSTTIAYGKSLTLTTTRAVTDGGPSGQPGSATLLAKMPGSSYYSSVGTTPLVYNGAAASKATLSVKPIRNATYKWRFGGDYFLIGSESAPFTIKVAPTAADALSATSTRVGRTVYLWGSVKPTDAGATVVLQHLVSRTWKSTTTKVKIVKQKMPNGTTIVGFKLPIKATAKGSFSYRADVLANSSYAVTYGPTRVLKVS